MKENTQEQTLSNLLRKIEYTCERFEVERTDIFKELNFELKSVLKMPTKKEAQVCARAIRTKYQRKAGKQFEGLSGILLGLKWALDCAGFQGELFVDTRDQVQYDVISNISNRCEDTIDDWEKPTY
tara:strand:- start:276 stop:653 length:378 start_codon:yes stop_codon:yes gene_type:complete